LDFDSIKKKSLNKKNNKGETPLYIAGYNDNVELVEYIITTFPLIEFPDYSKMKLRISLTFSKHQKILPLSKKKSVKLFAIFILYKNGELIFSEIKNNIFRLFNILSEIPIELNMKICNLIYENKDEFISENHVKQCLEILE